MTSSRQQLQALIDALLTNGALTDVQRSIVFSHAELQNIPQSEAEQMIEETLKRRTSVPPHVPPVAEQSGFVVEEPPVPPAVIGEGSTFVSGPSTASTTGNLPAHVSGVQFGTGTGFTDVDMLSRGERTFLQKARLDGRWVVVRRLQPAYRDTKEYTEAFFKEYFASRVLEHPHIVDIYGRGEDAEGPFFYREYIDGQSLAQRMQAETIIETRLIRKIALEVLDALLYAHTKNVYHGNLLPDDILITTRGSNVKVLNFGRVDVGTVTPAAARKTDLQDFGRLILELFTGSRNPQKLDQMPADYWQTVVHRCLAEGRDRFTDAAEVRDFIQSHSSSVSMAEPAPKATPKQQTPLPPQKPVSPPSSQPLRDGSQRLPSETLILVLGILSLLTCTCGIVFSIITLVLASQSEKIYAQNPSIYMAGSRRTVQAGKVCAIIGLVLGILGLGFWAFIQVLNS